VDRLRVPRFGHRTIPPSPLLLFSLSFPLLFFSLNSLLYRKYRSRLFCGCVGSCGPTRRAWVVASWIQTSPSLSSRATYLPPVPLLSASPQGFCAPPRNVIFPPAAFYRLPIFAEAIIAHRSSRLSIRITLVPRRSVIPRHTSIVLSSFTRLSRHRWGWWRRRRNGWKRKRSITKSCYSPLLSCPVFSIDICLDKTESPLPASGGDYGCLNYSNLRQANESAAQTASRRLSPTSKPKPPTIDVFLAWPFPSSPFSDPVAPARIKTFPVVRQCVCSYDEVSYVVCRKYRTKS